MTDQAVSPANLLKEFAEVSLPDVVDGGTWLIYQDAQEQYRGEMEKAQHVPLVAYCRFVGIGKLVKRQVIHISGPGAEKLKSYLQQRPELGVPGPIIQAVSIWIGMPFEASFGADPNGVGPNSLSALLGTTSGPSATNNP